MEEKKDEKKIMVKGHVVSYSENASGGIRYLVHLIEAQEAKVFFDQAFSRGHAEFEDQMGYNYKLIHHGSEYQLEKIV